MNEMVNRKFLIVDKDYQVECLRGHGNGKNITWEEKLYFNAFEFIHKTFVFPLETLHSFAKILRSLTKVLHSPEKLCIHSQKY